MCGEGCPASRNRVPTTTLPAHQAVSTTDLPRWRGRAGPHRGWRAEGLGRHSRGGAGARRRPASATVHCASQITAVMATMTTATELQPGGQRPGSGLCLDS